MSNMSRRLLAALRDAGAREVFGIPGDFALGFFRQIEESGLLPLYTLSHEPGIGFAADAASRISGRIGVAAVTYGAGALNMINPIAQAYAEKSPVVVISGAPGLRERDAGWLLHHQAKTLDSQRRMYQEVTCAQACLDDPARAPQEIARVLGECLAQSRPVYIEIPRDLVAAPCDAVPPLPQPVVDADALAACADEVLARLRGARSPVLMAGVEVRRFGLEAKVAELARRLDLPVATSFLGSGLFAGEQIRRLGTYLGLAGDPAVTRLVEESDALCLLGVILSDTNFGVSTRRIDLRGTIQALDRQVVLGHHVYPALPLAALIDALLARTEPVAGVRPVAPAAVPSHLTADDAPITPRDIAAAVNDLMAEHGSLPLVSDVGDCLFTALDMGLGALLAPGYYASMGFAVPAGLGVQAASGQRPIVLVGDGAFQMTGWELGHCRRYGWDPIVIVFNNRSWQMLRTFEPAGHCYDLDDWRFADMADAMGGIGVRVRTRAELAAALQRAATTRGRFVLIDVVLPDGALSDTLARFVGSVKRVSMQGQ